MLRRIITISLLCLSLSANAVDYDSVYKAYKEGDYATALAGFTELAGQDHMKARFYLGAQGHA